MSPIRALIVDDEPLARENLRLRLSGVADVEIAGECANGRETIRAIREMRPDVVFLDIEMPDMSGFEVLEQLPVEQQPVVVFVTAYDRYALEAFRVHALDYLLKPFADERFAAALERCREKIARGRRPAAGEPLYQLTGDEAPSGGPPPGEEGAERACLTRLVIKARGRVFFLKTADVDWIEANGDYARLHVAESSYLLRRTMHEMDARLDPRCFARVSRSAIVNLERIRELRPLRRGEFVVQLTTGPQVKLTRTYREKLERLLGDHL